jgi:hypothetical protein
LLAAILAAGAVWSTAQAAPTSPYRDLTGLVNATMSAFVQALSDRNMDGFAPRFVSFDDKPQKLEKAYGGLYPHAEMFAQMRSFAPIVTDFVGADDRSGLVVRGFYPGKYRVSYEMQFVLEGTELKLTAFSVTVTPTESLES